MRPAIERPRAGARRVDDGDGPGLARLGGRADGIEVRRPPGRGRGAPLDRSHARDRLEAAGPAAAAQRAVIVDDVWPISPAPEPSPWKRAATEDQPGTDAAPDPDRDQVRDAIPARERVLGERPRPGESFATLTGTP